MKDLYKEENIKADYEKTEEHLDSYNQPDEPFLTRMICEFHVCWVVGTPSTEGNAQPVRS